MVRIFVESVLRYGLPVNFVVAMYRVRRTLSSGGCRLELLT